MKYAFKKMRRIRLYDPETRQHKVTLNDFKSAKFTGDSETVYAEGADGAKLASFDINKVAAFEGTNGAIDSGFLAIQVGSDEVEISNGEGVKLRAELVTSDGTTVSLPHTARGDLGNEIGFIYRVDVNGMPDSSKTYTQAAAASATEFAYNPQTNVITLPTGVFKAKDTVVVDYHPRFSKYTQINNDGDKFSGSYHVIVDAWFTDLCTQKDVPLQVVMERGKVSGALDLSFGDQAAVQAVSIEALTSACYGSSKNLWKLYNYDEEEIIDDEIPGQKAVVGQGTVGNAKI